MAEYDPCPNARAICEDNIHRKLEYINKANASVLSAYEAGQSDALEFCFDFIIKNGISNESKKELSRDLSIMRDMHSRHKKNSQEHTETRCSER